ncbi:MAG: hypothetical protein H7296_13940 [Bacteroidia bacterium]|nr:hypothetical protein [Bacteroidia bacterium]
MKKNIPHFLLFMGIVLLLSGCKGIYEPNVVNMPLLEEKREYTVTVSHKNIQVAYALKNHLAVMGNAFYTNIPTNTEIGYQELGEGGKGILVEGAVGYFNYYPDLDITFETYAGLGYGHSNFSYNSRDNNGNLVPQTFNSNGFKYFIQPDIGFKTKYFDWALGTRFSAIEYLNPTITNAKANIPNDRYSSVGTTTYIFLEPALTLRFGFRRIKLQVQYIHSMKLNNSPLYYTDYSLNAGLFFNFNNSKLKGPQFPKFPKFPKRSRKTDERKG